VGKIAEGMGAAPHLQNGGGNGVEYISNLAVDLIHKNDHLALSPLEIVCSMHKHLR